MPTGKAAIEVRKSQPADTSAPVGVHRQVRSLVGIGLTVLMCGPLLVQASEPQVVHFSPRGTVKGVRQVTARFSEPMAPLGDPRGAPDPFAIDCPEPGTARWVDSRTWAFDFARDLPAGVRCAFEMRSDVVTLAGKPVGGERRFGFSTGGPAVMSSRPFKGSQIEEEQAFALILDVAATEASIVRYVWFAIEGIRERVGVRVVDAPQRDAILQTLSREDRSQPIVVLQARQRFPNGAKVSLTWGAGVAAASGVATEQDQVLEFATRPVFTATMTCERENADADCTPLRPITLGFSAPVAWEQAQRIMMSGPGEQRWEPASPETPAPFVFSVDFRAPFPEASTLRVALPDDLRDDAGRPLGNASEFPLAVKTAPFPPLAKFSSRFGIIEWKADPVLPVTLRNVEAEVLTRLRQIARPPRSEEWTLERLWDRVTGKVTRVSAERVDEIVPWLRKVGRVGRTRSVFDLPDGGTEPAGTPSADRAFREFALPKPNGARALEVVGIPFDAPGLYVVELASPRLGASLLGQERPLYVPAAVLVTNLSVHFKWGRENALVWVTTLDRARPVANASVSIRDCRGRVVWSGASDGDGIARVEGLPAREEVPSCYEPPRFTEDEERDFYNDSGQTPALNALAQGLFITAQTDDDLSFVHSGWDQGIEPWRFQLPSDGRQGPLVAHTIFDRSLLRAGETVHMKHLVRLQTLDGFSLPPTTEQPTVLTIRHLGSDQKYELPLRWDAAGSAENDWTIPREAKLGQYEVVVSRPSDQAWRTRWVSGSFRVEEFRVPLMRAVVQLPAVPQVAVTEVPVDVSVQYLAGGGAGNLPLTLRAQVRPKAFQRADEFERFTFGNGPVQEGIVRRGVTGDEDEEAARDSAETAPPPGVHQRLELALDEAGAARAQIADLPRSSALRELLAEIEFRDPNGEVQTVASTVPLWPASHLVGLKAEQAASRNSVKVTAAAVDTAGQPVAGAPVRVDVHQRRTYTHRKRLVGGFYGYEHIEEVSPRLVSLCEGRTDGNGTLRCEGSPGVSGNVILQATTTDDGGRQAAAHVDTWVAGAVDWWFEVADSDRIDVLPERRHYEPGERARFQVRMPFRAATALVTVEREGIADAMVTRLSGKEPVVEIPVKDRYAPNMFVSVLAVRGRVGDVQPTAMADLGKPAFKLGVAEIRVGQRAHELKVAVTPERATYRVRENAAVKIVVRTAAGEAPPAGSEVAVAAVDEGLLELQPNRSWNLLEAMMGRRGYGMRTATAQLQVVGKRHYGRKALPPGGGGGQRATRELFDTLLFWKGRVVLDERGDASVTIPLNDSLTSFRIVAVATAGVGQFGSGWSAIRSTQELMLFSGVAPLVREGDQFPAEFTVRNTTDRSMELTLRGLVEGLGAPLEPREIRLAPREAQVVGWDVTAPVGAEVLRYEIEASERGGPSDRVRVTQQVRPAVPERTFQATLFRWEAEARQVVARPADAIPGRGGIHVALAPTLGQGLEGVRGWMRGYPYGCLEQRVSRAVVLRDEASWHDIVATLPAYQDADGLLKYFPTEPVGSEVLTAYVLSITRQAGLTIPTDIDGKMQAGLRRFAQGSIARQGVVQAADLPLRKLAAIEALARAGGADAQLLDSIAIEPNLWPTSAVLDWWTIVQRVPEVPRQAERRREAEQIVRARLNLQGTTMGFSTERGDGLWWLMVCPDTNAVRLLLNLVQTTAWREDLPRLMRGALGRQRRGRWDCTVTNAWGALAVEEFSRAFEATPITGTSRAALGEAVQTAVWPEPAKRIDLQFPWPSAAETLSVDHEGTGAPWVTIESRAAIPLTAPLSSGYRVKKTVTPPEPGGTGQFSRGDVLQVKLEIDAQSDMTWVVINDPIPAGASHLGTGLARDTQIVADARGRDDEVSPVYVERAFEAFRAYYTFVRKGTFSAEYAIRLNQSGRFQLPATRVEALYAPEMFGELPNADIEVAP